jgi:predicted Zn finger-like uncharacterized protein
MEESMKKGYWTKIETMRCPYCHSDFKISQEQLDNNSIFKCSHCGQYNYGSCEFIPNTKTLIGISKADYLRMK